MVSLMIVPVDHSFVALRNHGCILLKDIWLPVPLSFSLYMSLDFYLSQSQKQFQSQHVSHGFPTFRNEYYQLSMQVLSFLPSFLLTMTKTLSSPLSSFQLFLLILFSKNTTRIFFSSAHLFNKKKEKEEVVCSCLWRVYHVEDVSCPWAKLPFF